MQSNKNAGNNSKTGRKESNGSTNWRSGAESTPALPPQTEEERILEDAQAVADHAEKHARVFQHVKSIMLAKQQGFEESGFELNIPSDEVIHQMIKSFHRTALFNVKK